MAQTLREQQKIGTSGQEFRLTLSISRQEGAISISMQGIHKTKTEWLATINSVSHIVRGVEIDTGQPLTFDFKLPLDVNITNNVHKDIKKSPHEVSLNVRMLVRLQDKYEWAREDEWSLPGSSTSNILPSGKDCFLHFLLKIEEPKLPEQMITCTFFAR
jgi:hypothetical protein